MSIMDYMDNPYAPTTFGPSRRAGVSMPKDAPVSTTPAPGSGATPPPAAGTPTTAPAAGTPSPAGTGTAGLPYGWYTRNFGVSHENVGDNDSPGPAMLTQEQWQAMDPTGQARLVQQNFGGADVGDPFYDAVRQRFQAAGGNITSHLVMANDVKPEGFRDPSKVWTDPVTGLPWTDQDNLVATPDLLNPARGIGIVLTAGAAGAALAAEGAGTAATGAAAAAPEGAALTAPELLAPTLPAIPAGSGALLTAPELAGGLSATEAGAGAALAPALAGGAPEAAGATLPGATAASVPFEGTPFPLSDPGVTLPDMPAINTATPGLGDRLINGITSNPLPLLGLGANLFAQHRAAQSGNNAADQVRDVVKPISDTGKGLLEQYGRGELNPADEFQINRWEHEQIAKAQNYYAKAGMGDSTAALSGVAKVREQAQGMRDTALKGLLQMGLQASGMAIGPLIQAIQLQAKDDEQFSQSMSGALNSLMLLQAWQSKTPGIDG